MAFSILNEYLCLKNMLGRKIKLIWDFRGPEALETAKHHVVHLEEFARKENLFFNRTGVEKLSDWLSIAYISVNEEDMIIYRDALKPHRGLVDHL